MTTNAIVTKGLKPYMRKIANRQARLKNLTPAYKRAVTLYHQWVLRNFDAEGGLHSNKKYKWEKSQRATEEEGKTLQDTGRLRRDWELRSGSRQGVIQSKVAYSAAHEEGAVIPAAIIRPKRAKALRWVGKDGTVYFAKSVKRPKIILPQRKIFPEIKQAEVIIRPAFEDYLDWDRISIIRG